MTLQSIPEDEIAAAVAASLLPPPFAPRRDVEVAGAVRPGGGAVCFFDAFWPVEGRLALAVGRVPRGGVSGALGAACLRRLLRSMLTLDAAPEAAVSAACELHGREFAGLGADLLLMTLEVRTRRLDRAGRGRVFASAPSRPGGIDPGRDEILWLVGGDAVAAGALPGPGAELGPAARAVADRCGPGSAVLGLVVRAGLRPATARNFTMPNDLHAIARLTARVEAALAEAGVPETASAALGLAMDEVLTNVVTHGYTDGGRHEVLVDLSVGSGQVEIRLRDDGLAFDPLLAPEPDLTADLDARRVGGLGVHLARQLVDAMEYSREKGWNVLRLRKRFSL